MKRNRPGLIAVLTLGLVTAVFGQSCSSTSTDRGSLPMWKIEGSSNTVWLLGSVHLLPERAHPFPAAFDDAFQQADVVAFEIDLLNVDPLDLLPMLAGAIIPGQQTIEDLVSDETWALLEPRLDAIAEEGISFGSTMDMPGMSGPALASQLRKMQPWLIGFLLQNGSVDMAGFKPELGVDMHYLEKLKTTTKQTAGLETLAAQFGVFKRIAGDDPDAYLQSILASDPQQIDYDAMVDAWISADLDALEELINGSLAAHPDAYEILLSERNRNWIPHIERFLRSDEDHLVIVGAGHLVGRDSVVELLREKGYEVRQL